MLFGWFSVKLDLRHSFTYIFIATPGGSHPAQQYYHHENNTTKHRHHRRLICTLQL